MGSDVTGSAADFLPARRTLPTLRRAAQGCRGCPLYRGATQVVFGEGAAKARVMLVGEQPGNEEDLDGHPFVGPAGRLLDRALEAAGVDRGAVYVTNAVKHFKYEVRGKKRLHQKPSAAEVNACRPWLEAELEVVKPEILVCLGATAAQALLGRSFRVTKQRGVLVPSELAPHVLATWHPSAVLRAPDEETRHRQLAEMTRDFGIVAKLLRTSGDARAGL